MFALQIAEYYFRKLRSRISANCGVGSPQIAEQKAPQISEQKPPQIMEQKPPQIAEQKSPQIAEQPSA